MDQPRATTLRYITLQFIGPCSQSVVSPTTYTGIACLKLSRSHTIVDHEMILGSFSALTLSQLQAKICAQREWLGELTILT